MSARRVEAIRLLVHVTAPRQFSPELYPSGSALHQTASGLGAIPHASDPAAAAPMSRFGIVAAVPSHRGVLVWQHFGKAFRDCYARTADRGAVGEASNGPEHRFASLR